MHLKFDQLGFEPLTYRSWIVHFHVPEVQLILKSHQGPLYMRHRGSVPIFTVCFCVVQSPMITFSLNYNVQKNIYL